MREARGSRPPSVRIARSPRVASATSVGARARARARAGAGAGARGGRTALARRALRAQAKKTV